MRLLHFGADGELTLTEFFAHDIPPYAILSHTWEEEEATFQDVIEQRGKQNPGYRKILFCGKQARQDGLEYFWVDTCCIDKNSSVELSDAINSMFRWYQNAQKCYVYLADVSYSYSQPDEPARSTWQSALPKSRWFTRGWTLQELIAPPTVEFFSADGYQLGDRQSLEQVIHEITGLPTRALQGYPLSEFSIEERLSWSRYRYTARAEDSAYCLLGIFGVVMPVILGEGKENAFKRLRKRINKLNSEVDEIRHFSVPQQVLEESKGKRSVLIHELAIKDQSFEHLKSVWTGADEDLKPTVEKAADFNKSTAKWSLKRIYWKELDIWNYQYKNLTDRQSAIDNTIKAYDRQRIQSSDAVWERLLPKEDRGKNIVLSKLQATIAKRSTTTPEISVQMTEDAKATAITRQMLLSKSIPHINLTPQQLQDFMDESPSTTYIGKDLERTADGESESSELEDIESIFSDSGLSMSSKSSVELNPVRISGIREITRVLLSHEDFKSLCTATVNNVAPEKSRTHIRGFLKDYGQELVEEAHSPLQHQAAIFVREVAGRIADELKWSIMGYEDVRELQAPGEEKPNLEKWLSTIEHGWSPTDDDGSHSDESEDDPDTDAAFPNIDAARDFLVSSKAFGALLQAFDSWINTKKRPALSAMQRANSASQSARIVDTNDVASHNDMLLADTSAPTASEKFEKPIVNSSITESSLQPAGRLKSFRTIVQGQAISILGRVISIYHLELFAPSTPTGFERIRWRCSCNTILWGDFPLDDSRASAKLKEDLFKNPSLTARNSKSSSTRDRSTQQPSSFSGEQASTSHKSIDRPDTTSQTLTSTVSSSFNSGQSCDRLGLARGASAPSNASGKHLVSLTQVAVDRGNPIYFEVCTNVGNSAVGHFELDITQTATDGELFKKIWEIYTQSRGFGLRRLFLRPRDVHFVLFSVSARPAARYSAGIHKKPQEYPPDAEIQQQRYHYLTPKIMMPPHIFIHFLHRARLNMWREHSENIWLKRLPKKLNESLLEAQDTETNPDLVFGWGIHILDGPNHAVLGLLLSVGLLITFVVSCLILGIAKTQEQAFGVGQYLIAIIVAFMSAVYFKLQDQ